MKHYVDGWYDVALQCSNVALCRWLVVDSHFRPVSDSSHSDTCSLCVEVGDDDDGDVEDGDDYNDDDII